MVLPNTLEGNVIAPWIMLTCNLFYSLGIIMFLYYKQQMHFG